MSHRRRSGDTSARGQSLVELALVTPIILLLFAAAADLGRAFYSYVAIENAAKEGALFGSRAPLCDDASSGTCTDPNNVVWRVQNELKEQGIRQPNGSALVPTVQCQTPAGVPRGNLRDCAEGDLYQVQVVYPFKLLTPILGGILGDLNLTSTSRAVVLNLAFDPTPGASINKFVSPTGAVNASDVTSKCLEPDDSTAGGFYRSPCRDSSTPEPNDFITLRFEEGTPIGYRIIVSNTGAQSLSGVTVTDSKGATGCPFATTIAVGATLPACDYTRTAPVVPGSATSMNYDNSATVDSAQTEPARSDVRVSVEKPPARLSVLKWVSPFKEGDDGDGVPGFGTVNDLTVTYRTAPQVAQGSAWFRIVIRNTGGQTATGLTATDSNGALPVNTDCPALPSTLAAGVTWRCTYPVTFTSASPVTTTNTVTATATNAVPTSDTASATLRVQACTAGGDRTVPNLIGLDKAGAQAAWAAAGFTGTLSTWGGAPNAATVTQSRPAFECVAATTGMTITRTTTP
jgi:hypothetical protein